jgi:hypothetical protein
MPSTTDYYNTLKTQLETQATNKKAALDLAYERATTVQFDAQGNMTRKKDATGKEKGPGTLDVQYAEQQRQMSGGAESSGMLKSGQFARDLATTQAGYRNAVVTGAAETEAAKTAISDETASELAKYQATYGTPATTGGGTGGGTPPTSSTPQTPPITAPPEFKPPSNPQLKQVTSRVTKKPAVVAKTPALPKKIVPKVPAPKRIGRM